ncbi:MAG: transglycosylase domain-containing protein [Myxococcales bacterium]
MAQQARARFGLEAEVGEVGLGLSSVRLHGLSLGGAEGPRVSVASVDVSANPVVAVFRGTRAIDGITARDVRVDLPLHMDSTRRFIGRVMGRGERVGEPAGGSTRADGSNRQIRIEGFDLKVRDVHGTLIAVEGEHAERGPEGARAKLASIRVGEVPHGRFEVDDVALVLDTDEGNVQLRTLRAGALSVVFGPAVPASAGAGGVPVADSAEEGARDDGAGATADRAPEEGAGEDAGESSEAQDGAVPEGAYGAGQPRTLARLKRAYRELRPGARGQHAAAEVTTAEPDQADGGRDPVLRRLSVGAELLLARGEVRAEAGGRPMLSGLHARAVAGERSLSFEGEGAARGGGSVAWDMTLWPAELRADGDVELQEVPLALLTPFLPSVPWHRPEDARIDAQLVVKTETVQRIAVSGRATVRDLAIASDRIAPQPVTGVEFTVLGRGHWLPPEKRLELAEAQVRVGAAEADLSGALEWSPDHYLVDLDARLPPTPCDDAIRVIPRDLLGELEHASWGGKLGVKVHVQLDSRDLDDTELDVDIDDRCQFLTVPSMADLRRFRMPFVHTVMEPDGSVFEMETGPGTATWTYLEDVSPFFVHAVLAHEDARFFDHHGFSLPHIRNALVKNLQRGRYVVGASTITMQLVKNVFLHREKTLARKIQEVLLTWWIERVMDKRDILELYLNVIEYGPGVYGIRNGARHYFNRLPSQLSPAESVYLSTILPNPPLYHSHFEQGALPDYWAEKMRRMFARMKARGWYSDEAVAYGLKELEDFRFVPEGTITEPRTIPGTTAPLPYMRAFDTEWNWDAPEGLLDGAKPEGGAGPSRAAAPAAHASPIAP